MLRKPLKDSDVEYRWSIRTNFRHIRKKAEKNAAIKLSIKKPQFTPFRKLFSNILWRIVVFLILIYEGNFTPSPPATKTENRTKKSETTYAYVLMSQIWSS